MVRSTSAKQGSAGVNIHVSIVPVLKPGCLQGMAVRPNDHKAAKARERTCSVDVAVVGRLLVALLDAH